MAPFDKPQSIYYQSAIVTIALSCISSEIKRDIGRNSQFFIPPPAFDARLTGIPSEHSYTVW